MKDAVHSVHLKQNAQAPIPKERDSDSDETVVYAACKPTTMEKKYNIVIQMLKLEIRQYDFKLTVAQLRILYGLLYI